MTFNVPVLPGPDLRTINSSHGEFDPVNPYCGPMVLLVSAQTAGPSTRLNRSQALYSGSQIIPAPSRRGST